MATGCKCRCHNWPRGTARACSHAQHYMTAFDWAQRASVWDYHMSEGVDVGDALEAALACQLCINLHTPALSGRPYPFAPRIVRRYVREQADGWVDPPNPNDP